MTGIRVLFLAWQAPDSGRVFPVARLLVLPDRRFELGYVAAVDQARAHGFEGLPELGESNDVLVTDQLPSSFRHRVVVKGRERALATDSRVANDTFDAAPVGLAVPRPGGGVDRFEAFAPPLPASATRVWGVFTVRGVGRVPEGIATAESLTARQPLDALAEPDNPINPHALRLVTREGRLLGYVPDYLASELGRAGAAPDRLSLRVERVVQVGFAKDSPRYHVSCRYECEAALGRSLFVSDAWAPSSPRARRLA